MACDMLDLLLNRTLLAFQSFEKKGTRFGTATDYIVPSEMCVMVNVVLETRNQALKLCTFTGVDVVSRVSVSRLATDSLSLSRRLLLVAAPHAAEPLPQQDRRTGRPNFE